MRIGFGASLFVLAMMVGSCCMSRGPRRCEHPSPRPPAPVSKAIDPLAPARDRQRLGEPGFDTGDLRTLTDSYEELLNEAYHPYPVTGPFYDRSARQDDSSWCSHYFGTSQLGGRRVDVYLFLDLTFSFRLRFPDEGVVYLLQGSKISLEDGVLQLGGILGLRAKFREAPSGRVADATVEEVSQYQFDVLRARRSGQTMAVSAVLDGKPVELLLYEHCGVVLRPAPPSWTSGADK